MWLHMHPSWPTVHSLAHLGARVIACSRKKAARAGDWPSTASKTRASGSRFRVYPSVCETRSASLTSVTTKTCSSASPSHATAAGAAAGAGSSGARRRRGGARLSSARASEAAADASAGAAATRTKRSASPAVESMRASLVMRLPLAVSSSSLRAAV